MFHALMPKRLGTGGLLPGVVSQREAVGSPPGSMRILADGPAGEGTHEFAVELEIEGGAGMRELWDSATEKGQHGVPFAPARCEGGKIDPPALRASLERISEAPDDGWRWNPEALAVYLPHELRGVALVGWPEPPGGGWDNEGDRDFGREQKDSRVRAEQGALLPARTPGRRDRDASGISGGTVFLAHVPV